ncbi:MAG: hypothetical protein LQ350_001159 [Teloschistes chrysophthalmus]|nr:MAG: hypothetical protein LQ350_001159 [Niorma chrysophthalma]
MAASASATLRSELTSQWSNPSDILSLLLIIGPAVVQGAVAQLSGSLITPVCFSFGWVAYAFTTAAALAGSGTLMPETDVPCKVINTQSGYVRGNRSWLVGRVLRDCEPVLDRKAFCIKVYDCLDETAQKTSLVFGFQDAIWRISVVIVLAQLAISALPWAIYGDWSILLITGAGTLLALITGALPQWKAEKFACRKNSKKIVAITPGNGSRFVMVVRGNGHTMDIEDLASIQSPKLGYVWDGCGYFTRLVSSDAGTNMVLARGKPGVGVRSTTSQRRRKAIMLKRLPLDFCFTRLICTVLALCWVALLISTSSLKEHSWYLVLVGGIGMVQNAIVSAVARDARTRGFHLYEAKDLRGEKTMNVLMDLERFMPGIALSLRDEFFPGKLREDEESWWAGDRDRYDTARFNGRKGDSVSAIVETVAIDKVA